MPNLLDAPIPGQSLTKPPKSSVLEHPPRFVKKEELHDFFFQKLTSEKGFKQTVLLLKAGASAESLARTFMYTGVMQGLYNTDLMLTTAEDVYYLILAIAKVAGVENLRTREKDAKYEEFVDSLLPALKREGAAIDTPEEEAVVRIFSGLGEMDDTEESEGVFNMEETE